MKKEIRNCARILDKARRQAKTQTSEERAKTNIDRIKEKAQEMGIKLAKE